jgi:hypothetical protein
MGVYAAGKREMRAPVRDVRDLHSPAAAHPP